MNRYAIYALCAAMTASATPSLAQSASEGQSCGGLLCDIGVFGHKTAPVASAEPAPPPPAPAQMPAPATSRQADAAPLAADDTDRPAPKKPVVHRKKRIAKATVDKATVAKATVDKATIVPPPTTAPAPSVAESQPKVVTGAIPQPEVGTVDITKPYASPSPTLQFHPIYQ